MYRNNKWDGHEFMMIAGPCSIESRAQLLECAKFVKNAGANILRGGAYKPRTSPHDFQGLGIKGLEYLKEVGQKTNMATVTEVMDTRDVGLVSEYVDILQIGARNMQNFNLLVEAGKSGKPILLKRGMSASIKEILGAIDYIVGQGNEQIILCERGIKTFESCTRNTLDLSSVALLKKLTPFSVIVDPSHATGRRDLVLPMSLSAIMAGADGLQIEVHPKPEEALSDCQQQLNFDEFATAMKDIQKVLYCRSELECTK